MTNKTINKARKKNKSFYSFLTKKEILEIANLIEKTQKKDTKTRLFLLLLKYRSVDIQNFRLTEAGKLICNDNIPNKIKFALQESLIERKKSIEKNHLTKDIEYLFVDSKNNKIHDGLFLSEWRKFLIDNNLPKMTTHIVRQSILQLQWADYLENKKEKQKTLNVLGHSTKHIESVEDFYVK